MKIIVVIFLALVIIGIIGAVFRWIIDNIGIIILISAVVLSLVFFPSIDLLIIAGGAEVFLITRLVQKANINLKKRRLDKEKKRGVEKERRKREEMLSNYPLLAREIITTGEKQIAELQSYGAMLEDRDIQVTILRLEGTFKRLLKMVEEEPSNADRLGKIVDYYLPTANHLIGKYSEYSKHDNISEISEAESIKREIKQSIVSLDDAMNNLLKDLSQSITIDILSDISVMKRMLEMDGLRFADAAQWK